jgi:hypothetical protein
LTGLEVKSCGVLGYLYLFFLKTILEEGQNERFGHQVWAALCVILVVYFVSMGNGKFLSSN